MDVPSKCTIISSIGHRARGVQFRAGVGAIEANLKIYLIEIAHTAVNVGKDYILCPYP